MEGMALMLDHPEKTPRLLAALKAAAPFEVDITGLDARAPGKDYRAGFGSGRAGSYCALGSA